jgi:hypothetical protein
LSFSLISLGKKIGEKGGLFFRLLGRLTHAAIIILVMRALPVPEARRLKRPSLELEARFVW